MADITSNLVVYYPFNSDRSNYASGSAVDDTTNFGTTIDTSTFKFGGGSLRAVASSSQYLQMNNITTNSNFFTSSTNGISFSLWINYTTSGSFARVFDIGRSSSNSFNTMLYLKSSGTLLSTLVSNGAGLSSTQDIGNYTGTGWKHIVWTLTYSAGTTSTWNIYVDGTNIINASNQRFPTTAQSSFIARSNFSGDGYYNGYVDEFCIYQRVLTQADVTALYNGSNPTPIPVIIPCFREGTKILCLHNGKEDYLPVEKLRSGILVKTLLEGYVPIDLIGKKKIYNSKNLKDKEDRLFLCSKEKYPELLEDLYITGYHAVLVDELTEEQKEKTLEIMGDIFITEDRYRLLTCLDERAKPFEEPGEYTIYHFALENDNHQWNYGVYANGLLVESCSKEHIESYSGMDLL